ncbi:MAG: hypothetical protein EBV86_15125 [Marivivens sp.]|nr:hypothetical protein [Marivivens sp.]
MNQQRFPAIKVSEDIFGPPAQSVDPLACQTIRHIFGERPTQVGTVDRGFRDDFFETVREDEKAGRVQGVFTSVASKYDIMNDVMSVGIHRVWKDAMMDWLAPRPGQKLLDVAGGTGDISFRFLKRAGSGHSTVLDLTESMLVAGRQRAEADMMQKAYDLYSFNVIPRMGQLIANDRDSYQYLVESIRKFPDQDTFLSMVKKAGFENAKYRNLSLGIAALHSGWKI